MSEEIELTQKEQPGKSQEEKLQEEVEQLRKQLLRLTAEFDNYRKRVTKEKQEMFLDGKVSVLLQLVNFVDIFDKAIEMMSNPKDTKSVVSGIELLKKEFGNFLDKEGVKSIESIERKFDPNLHEAVGYEISNDEEGIIVKEVQKGYCFNDFVIRPAKVIVRKKEVDSYYGKNHRD